MQVSVPEDIWQVEGESDETQSKAGQEELYKINQ